MFSLMQITNSSHFETTKIFSTKYYEYYHSTTQGISTYDYIIALREQEQEQQIGGQQSPQMSPVSSLTGLSSASSFTTFHRGAWCTPPRLFLEDQVTFSYNYCYLLMFIFLYFTLGPLHGISYEVFHLQHWCIMLQF